MLCCRRRHQREIREALLNKVPACLQESECPCWQWKEYDKAFACVSAPNCSSLGAFHSSAATVIAVTVPNASCNLIMSMSQLPHETLPMPG